MDYKDRKDAAEVNERKPSATTPLFTGATITNCWVDGNKYRWNIVN